LSENSKPGREREFQSWRNPHFGVQSSFSQTVFGLAERTARSNKD
jgi:hypothetical protein